MVADPPGFSSLRGTGVKAAFTIWPAERYAFGMVIFASLALAAAALSVPLERAEPQAVGPVRQAIATVTILRPEPLRFADIESDQPERLRDAVLRGPDGSAEPVRLVEFQ